MGVASQLNVLHNLHKQAAVSVEEGWIILRSGIIFQVEHIEALKDELDFVSNSHYSG